MGIERPNKHSSNMSWCNPRPLWAEEELEGRQAVVEQYPWVAVNLFKAFEEAKAVAMQRMQNPRVVPLAWYRDAWEEQEKILGPDPWEYGLTGKNRKNLETLIGYSHEQGLIKQKPAVDDLFLNVSQGRKRGSEFRI